MIRSLKAGDSGPRVEVLQTTLKAIGYYEGPIDGFFGPFALLKAVKDFQHDWNLVVDGIVGPKTECALTEARSDECTPDEAVARARRWAGRGGQYRLGTGDYNPAQGDRPWTGLPPASDCAGFAFCFCWRLKRHRPGFNRGRWATVSDDINTDSALEDALHHKELFIVVTTPQPGDLLVFGSVRKDGKRIRIGHVGLIESVPTEWDPLQPQYSSLTIIQCKGPNGRAPGVVRTDGALWDRNDVRWPKPEHRTYILRVKLKA